MITQKLVEEIDEQFYLNNLANHFKSEEDKYIENLAKHFKNKKG